ncbi:MAG TPA: sodium:solute symporter family protein [Patescibacteria group bacterium]|nr:sodium:solute symporter family protein [Patescibacteria group bacterium]
MSLTFSDWWAIGAYLGITLVMGLYFRRRSGRSTEDYFVSGREVSWWLAGTSMVATTFAADTPLAVTGLVYKYGISGNWLWWSFLPSGMMTVFLFARMWRRSGLLTDVQFAELRYSGRPAAFLRGFRALYLGLLMNCLILGWVTKAMVSITSVVLGIQETRALAICVFFLIPFTGIYVTLGGLWGVLWTDLFQFVLKMGIVIAVAAYGISAAGGIDGVLAKLAAERAAAVAKSMHAGNITSQFPSFGLGLTAEELWTLPVIAFVVNLCVQWWAAWYPGAEPGGGGYIAQRIFSTRDERHGLLSVLWFNVAHYAVRPWPWILTAMVAVALYPGLQHPESGYMLVAVNFLPHAMRGLLVAGFLAAFMSTFATQLNWGSSYLVSDFYRRFLRRKASEAHYVAASRVATLLLVGASALVASQLSSVVEGWKFVLELGAGTGAVYMLRWYWWRINAWSEISAMVAALAVSVYLLKWPLFTGTELAVFAWNSLVITAVATSAWVAVTLATRPEPQEVLVKFYRMARPQVTGWKPVAQLAPDIVETRDLGANLRAWLLGCAMVYSALFAVGDFCLKRAGQGAVLAALAAVCAWLVWREIARQSWREQQSTPAPASRT